MKLWVLGASGHGRVIADILLAAGDVVLCGFLDDDPRLAGRRILGCPVRSTEAFLRKVDPASPVALLLGIGDNRNRREVDRRLAGRPVTFATAVHPAATVGRDVRIGEGTVVMAGAVVNPGTRIGRHAIINTGAVVDHDCEIGDFAHVSPGSVLAGGVRLGELSQVGLGAAVLPGKRVGKKAMVGAGSVVISDVPDGSTFAGVPAKALPRKRHEQR